MLTSGQPVNIFLRVAGAVEPNISIGFNARNNVKCITDDGNTGCFFRGPDAAVFYLSLTWSCWCLLVDVCVKLTYSMQVTESSLY